MNIFVATDGSRGGTAAVRFTARLAARLAAFSPRTRLEIVMVGDLRQELFESGYSGRISSLAGRREEARIERALRRAATEAAAEGARARCRFVEAPGLAPIADVILDMARRSGADLVVAGSTGRGAVELALFGSVARRLILKADRPLAIVPRYARRPRRGPLRFVAATDGSSAASDAVRFAARLTREAGARRLTIIHAATLRHDLALIPAPLVPRLRSAIEPIERKAARLLLDAARRQAESKGCPAVTQFIEPRTAQSTADVIARYTRRTGADLVAVGSEGANALGGRLLGSVTRRLLRVSWIPVVVVPPGTRPGRKR